MTSAVMGLIIPRMKFFSTALDRRRKNEIQVRLGRLGALYAKYPLKMIRGVGHLEGFSTGTSPLPNKRESITAS